MASSKKCYRVEANSILESVIALCIISVCLYIAIMIFSSVFTNRTSAKFYDTQNSINELFFLAQLNDSLSDDNSDNQLKIDEEIVNENLKKMTVHYKDSLNIDFEKSFYVRK